MSCLLIMLRWMVLYCPVKFAGLQQPEKQLDGDLSDRSKNLGFFYWLALLLFLPPSTQRRLSPEYIENTF